MRKLLIVATLMTLAVPVPGRAAAGCQTFQLGALGNVFVHNCRYVANGPGTYNAMNVSNWQISISKDGGRTWVTGARAKRAIILAPRERGEASIFAPGSGALATVAGDLVDLAIYPEPYIYCMKGERNRLCTTGEEQKVALPFAGYIEAHDS